MKIKNVYQKNTIIAIYNENEKCLLEKYNNCNLQRKGKMFIRKLQ